MPKKPTLEDLIAIRDRCQALAAATRLDADRALRRPSHRGITCAECGISDDGRRGWTLRLDVDDELVTFCPDCDRREFGDG